MWYTNENTTNFMPLSLLQYNIVSYALLLPSIINLFAWQSTGAARVFGGLFVIFQVIILGQLILPKQSLSRYIVPGVMAFTVLLLLLSTTVYIGWDLSPSAQAVVFLLLPAATSLLFRRRFHPQQTMLELDSISWKDFDLPPYLVFLCGAYALSIGWLYTIVFKASTVQAVSSPWSLIPPHFWIIYAVATALLVLICWYAPLPRFSHLSVSIHLFFSFILGVIVYRLGYGFDPFIHQATESMIAAQGLVLPKNPYYLGQYSLIVSLHRLVGLSLVWIDRLLVPVLAALTIPTLWQEVLTPQAPNRPTAVKNSHWLALSILLVPFASLTTTTPQGLGNLLFLWCVIASFALVLNATVPWNATMLWFVAAAAMAVHPIAGCAALVLMCLVSYELHKDSLRFPSWVKRSFVVEIVAFGSLLVPALFLVHGLLSDQSHTKVHLPSLQNWQAFLTSLPAFHASYRTLFYDLSYFITSWLPLLVVLSTLAVSLWLLLRYKTALLRVYAMTTLILLANAFLVATCVDLPDVISYETYSYAQRLLALASWSLLPLLVVGLIWLRRRMDHRSSILVWLMVLGLTWIMAGNLFAAYPRENRYEISHQYNTSAADFTAVRYISGKQKTDYVVLANQNTSAAAVYLNGFTTYLNHNGNDFYAYPLPTTSPLYQIYLDMTYQGPTKEQAKRAADLTGAHTVYFVLDSYWNNAQATAQRAQLEADDSITLEDGAVHVFTYRFN